MQGGHSQSGKGQPKSEMYSRALKGNRNMKRRKLYYTHFKEKSADASRARSILKGPTCHAATDTETSFSYTPDTNTVKKGARPSERDKIINYWGKFCFRMQFGNLRLSEAKHTAISTEILSEKYKKKRLFFLSLILTLRNV